MVDTLKTNNQTPETDDQVLSYYSAFVSDSDKLKLYSLFNPGELFMRQSRERVTLKLLQKLGRENLSDKTILEVGCGRGHQFGEYIRWGAWPENIAGIDILPEFIAEATKRYPTVRAEKGSALDLPYESESFDVVSQSTVMSSLLDPEQRTALAKEMIRVLKPGGMILWSDFRYNSPTNAHVRKVDKRQISQLFGELEITLQSTTLLPPIVRRTAVLSHALTSLLDTIPFLHSHLRGVFIKPEMNR